MREKKHIAVFISPSHNQPAETNKNVLIISSQFFVRQCVKWMCQALYDFLEILIVPTCIQIAGESEVRLSRSASQRLFTADLRSSWCTFVIEMFSGNVHR